MCRYADGLVFYAVDEAAGHLDFKFLEVVVAVATVPGVEPTEGGEQGEEHDFGVEVPEDALLFAEVEDLFEFQFVVVSELDKLLSGGRFQVHPLAGDEGNGIGMLHSQADVQGNQFFEFFFGIQGHTGDGLHPFRE